MHYKRQKTGTFQGKLLQSRVKSKGKNWRRALTIFVIIIYRIFSTLLIKAPKVQRFVQEILPALQSWSGQAEKNRQI